MQRALGHRRGVSRGALRERAHQQVQRALGVPAVGGAHAVDDLHDAEVAENVGRGAVADVVAQLEGAQAAVRHVAHLLHQRNALRVAQADERAGLAAGTSAPQRRWRQRRAARRRRGDGATGEVAEVSQHLLHLGRAGCRLGDDQLADLSDGVRRRAAEVLDGPCEGKVAQDVGLRDRGGCRRAVGAALAGQVRVRAHLGRVVGPGCPDDQRGGRCRRARADVGQLALQVLDVVLEVGTHAVVARVARVGHEHPGVAAVRLLQLRLH